MSHDAIREKIGGILEGISADIFQADRAVLLFECVSNNLESIRANNFGDLFGAVQQMCTATIILSLTRLFELPGSNELRNFPWLIQYLESNSEVLKVYKSTSGFADKLTDWRLAIDKAVAENKLTLEKLRMVRDKRLAHSERISDDKIDGPNWEEVETLLTNAKTMLSDMGMHLANIAYSDGKGDYFLTSDAKRTSTALDRLFKMAFVNSEARD